MITKLITEEQADFIRKYDCLLNPYVKDGLYVVDLDDYFDINSYEEYKFLLNCENLPRNE